MVVFYPVWVLRVACCLCVSVSVRSCCCCVVVSTQKRPRVFIQNVSVCTFKTCPCVPAPRAHVFRHTCAWCLHTRGRFGRTHEREEGEGSLSASAFSSRKQGFLIILSSTLTQCQVHASSPIFCLPRMAHVGSSRASEVHQKLTLDLTYFQFENRSRRTRSRVL